MLAVHDCPNLRAFPEPLYSLVSFQALSAGDNLSGFLARSHMLCFPSRLRELHASHLTGQSLPGSLCSSLPFIQVLKVHHCLSLLCLPPTWARWRV